MVVTIEKVKVKRVYDEASDDDGFRVLVDRLWPRGLARDEAKIDLWLKEAAPSTELRTWFGHDPDKWIEFKRRYFAELEGKGDALAPLRRKEGEGALTLLFSTRDEEHNNAVALKEFLRRRR